MAERVEAQLEAILQSPPFARSARRKEILAYVVRRRMEDPGAEISAATIASDVYGRGADFHPDEDAIVRVEMARVRGGLDSYYSTEGWNSGVRISIPKGSYAPVFQFATVEPVPPQSDDTAPPPAVVRSRPKWFFPAVLSLVVVLGASVIWRWSANRPPEIVTIQLPGALRQPSVSPDGSKIAFVWNGERSRDDIFTVTVGSSKFQRLTDGPEPNVSPAWSPDGRNIAFQRRVAAATRAVYLAPANGAPGQGQRLLTTIQTNVAGLAWTPDSRNLIVPDSISGGPLGLYLVSVATGDRHALIEGLNAFHPAVSPDGRTLAFIADGGQPSNSTLYTLPLDGDFHAAGPAQPLNATKGNGLLNTRWSFDGQSVYYTKPVGIAMRYVVSTGRVEQLSDVPEGVGTPAEYAPGKYVYLKMRKHGFIGRVEPDGAAPTASFQTVDEDSQPDLSPDGRQLVFTSSRDGSPGLWFSAPDGTRTVRAATSLAGNLPRWSPDSKEVVFSAGTSGYHSRLYVVSPDSSARILASDGADNQFPFYSRDGRYIYYSSNNDGAYRIWRVPREGGPPERITEAVASNADESPDGSVLYYSSNGQVYRMALADRRPELVFEGPLASFVRAVGDGIYVQVGTAARLWEVWFLPYDRKGARRVYAPGMPIIGWSPIPSETALVMGLNHPQSAIERLVRRGWHP